MFIAHNSAALIEGLLAVMDAGCIAAPVNHRWSAKELASVMAFTAPAAVLVDSHCGDLLQQAIHHQPPVLKALPIIHLGSGNQISHRHMGPKHHQTSMHASAAFPDISTEQLIQQQLQRCAHATARPAMRPALQLQLRMPPSGAALICYTSGTTGRPKAALLPHSALHAQSLCKLAAVRYRRQDVYLHLAPLFHVGGLSSLFAVLMAGGCHVVLPRFDAAAAMGAIRDFSVTSFIAVPTMVQDMARAATALGASGQTATAPGMQGVAAAVTGTQRAAASRGGMHGGMQSVERVLVGAGGTSTAMQVGDNWGKLLHRTNCPVDSKK